jgi:DNA-binding transcriptional LysR family regulator
VLLKPLNAFVMTIKQGGFAKAAHALGTSPSSISRLLAQLEEELGFSLLERTTRTLKLTEAGALFYEKAQEILTIYDSSKKNLGNLSNVLSGNLKIGAPTSISYLYITNCIDEFLKDYPSLKLHLVNGDHLLDLLEDDFDFVLHCRPLPDSNFLYKKLGTWTRTLCASPDYIKKNGLPKNIEELKKHNCLLHYDNKEGTWPLSVDGETKNIPINGNISTDSSLNLKNLACKGIGIAYLPSFIIFRELNDGTLTRILPQNFLPTKEIYAVYTKNRYRIKKVKALLDFLTEKIQQQ